MKVTPFISIQNVSKSFPAKVALKSVNLDVERGEIVIIIGPSGAGKTTLLRLIDLLDFPDEGRIVTDGVDTTVFPHLHPAIRRRIGMVFQQPILFDTSTFNNVAWSLRMRGFDERSVQTMVKETLDMVGLAGFERRRARTLSGGEAQRLTIARVMVYKPELMLLDEPTANLDPYNVAAIEEIITRINRETDTTIIMATHNMFEARRLGGRVVFLLNGEIVEVGWAKELFERPEDQRTASFIKGEMIY